VVVIQVTGGIGEHMSIPLKTLITTPNESGGVSGARQRTAWISKAQHEPRNRNAVPNNQREAKKCRLPRHEPNDMVISDQGALKPIWVRRRVSGQPRDIRG